MDKYRIVKRQTTVWPNVVYDIEKYYITASEDCDGKPRKFGWQTLLKSQFEYHRYSSYEEAMKELNQMKMCATIKDEILYETEF